MRSVTVIMALVALFISVALIVRGPTTDRSLGFALASVLCALVSLALVAASASL